MLVNLSMSYIEQIEKVKESHFSLDQDLSHWEFYCFRNIVIAQAIYGKVGQWYNVEYKVINSINVLILEGREFQTQYPDIDGALDLVEYFLSDWYRENQSLSDNQMQWLKSSEAKQLYEDAGWVRNGLDLGLINLDSEDYNEEIEDILKEG